MKMFYNWSAILSLLLAFISCKQAPRSRQTQVVNRVPYPQIDSTQSERQKVYMFYAEQGYPLYTYRFQDLGPIEI